MSNNTYSASGRCPKCDSENVWYDFFDIVYLPEKNYNRVIGHSGKCRACGEGFIFPWGKSRPDPKEVVAA